MGNTTSVQAIHKDGHEFHLNHVDSDSPILPAANIKQLYDIDPEYAKWVLEQTAIEAESRRQQERTIHRYVFIERIIGVVLGAVIAIFGFAAGSWLIYKGHDWAGVGICGTTLATIVTVFVTKNNHKAKSRSSASQESQPAPARRAPNRRAKSQKGNNAE